MVYQCVLTALGGHLHWEQRRQGEGTTEQGRSKAPKESEEATHQEFEVSSERLSPEKDDEWIECGDTCPAWWPVQNRGRVLCMQV